MSFQEVIAWLRAAVGAEVTVTMLPDETTMGGRLIELDGTGIDGALFGLAGGEGAPSGVALALFEDGFREARADPGEIVVLQGRVTLIVRRH